MSNQPYSIDPGPGDKWTVSVPGGMLSLAQQWLVVRCIQAYRKDLSEDAIKHLVHNVGRDWLITGKSHDTVGTWPKRMTTALRRANELTPELRTAIARIGSELGASVNSGRAYHCKIRTAFDWEAGDFSDEASCFFGNGCCNGAPAALAESGRFSALTFYNEQGKGIARCLMIRHPQIELSRWVLFNAYGIDLVMAARVLAQATGLLYEQVNLRNNGESGSLIYINNGKGYLLSERGGHADSDVDLLIPVPVEDRCDVCGLLADDCTRCPECDEHGCGECENCTERRCQCGTCGECEETCCNCQCCPHCETNN